MLVDLKCHILPVNSRGYYKFQVEIGAATTQDSYWNAYKYKYMVFNFVLCGNYQRAVTTWGASINQ